jgi:hypothetical protein
MAIPASVVPVMNISPIGANLSETESAQSPFSSNPPPANSRWSAYPVLPAPTTDTQERPGDKSVSGDEAEMRERNKRQRKTPKNQAA